MCRVWGHLQLSQWLSTELTELGGTFHDFRGGVGMSGMLIEMVRDGADCAKDTADDCGWCLSFTDLQPLHCGWFFPFDAQQSFCEADAA